jgi:zinc D-Ala-D-Ala carboxypeptidase
MLVTEWPDDAATRWPSFTTAEMACKCGCGALPAHGFMDRLQYVRTSADRPFVITSGARCPAHNSTVSRTTGRDGPHTTGLAVDIACNATLAFEIVQAALANGVRRIGIKQQGSGRFVHLDVVPGPAVIWTY